MDKERFAKAFKDLFDRKYGGKLADTYLLAMIVLDVIDMYEALGNTPEDQLDEKIKKYKLIKKLE